MITPDGASGTSWIRIEMGEVPWYVTKTMWRCQFIVFKRISVRFASSDHMYNPSGYGCRQDPYCPEYMSDVLLTLSDWSLGLVCSTQMCSLYVEKTRRRVCVRTLPPSRCYSVSCSSDASSILTVCTCVNRECIVCLKKYCFPCHRFGWSSLPAGQLCGG